MKGQIRDAANRHKKTGMQKRLHPGCTQKMKRKRTVNLNIYFSDRDHPAGNDSE
ncbi:hypothetical protein SAMN05444280_108123 [Tangfeifania diversioriginum]|uniref:Uncharacterized protein n=1 Tax=Tangfeifania diversioriginum TaxID=1168035 RepID=A0A1M6FD49_9BACT|nr:hypothetical protein SAMN05444280_108123 [Tangfeifania diversioriginum]